MVLNYPSNLTELLINDEPWLAPQVIAGRAETNVVMNTFLTPHFVENSHL